METTAAVPGTCAVLVIGGGPGGSYAASILAREGIDVVVLEADTFPRYHIGESLIPSLRYLLRFVDLESTVMNHGFQKKVGGAFKFNEKNREGFVDFLGPNGADQYVWNVLRSEFDDILFQHARKSGALVFDGARVGSVSFESDGDPTSRPVRAKYTRKLDGSSGEISFQYLIDASGRAGIMSTKYWKNRTYNDSLKNLAWWGYWKGTSPYAPGTARENAPFFEALRDESGWTWEIPLRGYTSVGLIMNQNIAMKKRPQAPNQSAEDFYLEQLKLTPNLWELVSRGELNDCPDGGARIKSASDFSYSASFYAKPGLRIVGDAGAFIDPFFSSGVHLAMSSALSAAASICAAIRGDCSEVEAANWHTARVTRSYTWFLMVVMGAYKQMRAQDEPILSDVNEGDFDRAFDFLKPVIQGSLDVMEKQVSQQQIVKTLEFCANIFDTSWDEEAGAAVLDKIGAAQDQGVTSGLHALNDQTGSGFRASLTADEQVALDYVELLKNLQCNENITEKTITSDVLEGRKLRLERGKLGLQLV